MTTAILVGYRAWVATDAGRLVSLYGFGHWPTRGWSTAECSRGRHGRAAPVDDCTCGIAVVLDLDELLSVTRKIAGLPWVIGAVDYKGPTCRGAYINGGEFTDPRSTVRVRRARLRQLVVLSPDAAPLRDVLGRTLGSDAVAGAEVDTTEQANATDNLYGLVALAGQVAARAIDPQHVDPSRLDRAEDLIERLQTALNPGQQADVPALRAELLACLL